MKALINTFITLLLSFTLQGCFPTVSSTPHANYAFAWDENASAITKSKALSSNDAVVASLEKGEPAPFTGILLSPSAMAKVISDIESADEQCAIEVKHAIDKSEIKCQLEIEKKNIDLDAEKKRRIVQVNLRNEQISDLVSQLEKESNDPIWLWAGGGAAGGVLLTIIGVLVANGISK